MGRTEWRKSSFSGSSSSACVEVALAPNEAAVRDSKHAAGPELHFPIQSWRTFLERRHM